MDKKSGKDFNGDKADERKLEECGCEFEVEEDKDHPFFTHMLVCKECGKVGNRFTQFS